jgi:hypothetical protein
MRQKKSAYTILVPKTGSEKTIWKAMVFMEYESEVDIKERGVQVCDGLDSLAQKQTVMRSCGYGNVSNASINDRNFLNR